MYICICISHIYMYLPSIMYPTQKFQNNITIKTGVFPFINGTLVIQFYQVSQDVLPHDVTNYDVMYIYVVPCICIECIECI